MVVFCIGSNRNLCFGRAPCFWERSGRGPLLGVIAIRSDGHASTLLLPSSARDGFRIKSRMMR